jgi:hypothetical protein
VVAELLDLAEQLVHVARILADQPALEHQRVALAGTVTDLAVAAEPLVGVDPDDARPERHAYQGGDAKVGDAQVGRVGMGGDLIEESLRIRRHAYCSFFHCWKSSSIVVSQVPTSICALV